MRREGEDGGTEDKRLTLREILFRPRCAQPDTDCRKTDKRLSASLFSRTHYTIIPI